MDALKAQFRFHASTRFQYTRLWLIMGFKVTAANADGVKAIPEKTEELDSQLHACVFSAGLAKPSCISKKKTMELRSLSKAKSNIRAHFCYAQW